MYNKSLEVGTWNIWFDKREPSTVAKFIQDQRLDLLMVQEDAIHGDVEEQQHIVAEAAAEIGFYYAFGQEYPRKPGSSITVCNAVMSRFPIVKKQIVPLNPLGVKYDGTALNDTRSVVVATVATEMGLVDVMSTHLQFSVGCVTTPLRMGQTRNLARVIMATENPVILGGDFNIGPGSEEINLLEKMLRRIGDEQPTWTQYPWADFGWRVDGLLYRPDNLLIDPQLGNENVRVVNHKYSDHQPVVGSVIFN